jgi:hypothetical protein
MRRVQSTLTNLNRRHPGLGASNSLPRLVCIFRRCRKMDCKRAMRPAEEKKMKKTLIAIALGLATLSFAAQTPASRAHHRTQGKP